jgi:NADH-quinone oxidoreductase subunit C
MALTNEFLLEKLQNRFGAAIIGSEQARDYLNIEVDANQISEIAGFLRSDAELNFMFLTDLCGVHMPEQLNRELGVVYHLHNLEENYRFRLKAWLPIGNPSIDTVSNIWDGANWMERETYDFFGIIFKNHPNLKRILNVDHMEVFPLRKEFPLEDTTREDKDDRFFGR